VDLGNEKEFLTRGPSLWEVGKALTVRAIVANRFRRIRENSEGKKLIALSSGKTPKMRTIRQKDA